ncbi:MAG TPA: hypothetical protein VMG12_17185 [Polyangiaceae bacterium]|nr:hypothetical protein [Polyangiaceae bacterium]
MTRLLLGVNHAFLFLCVSMYLGTGGSLVLFTFPIAPQLTVDNYYLQFVPQVTAATAFFTTMTKLMLVAGVVMLVSEWKRGVKWVPIVVLAAVVAATVLTEVKILPINEQMAAGIHDGERLHSVLGEWMSMNRIRTALWCVQWTAMMAYFGRTYFKLGRAL